MASPIHAVSDSSVRLSQGRLSQKSHWEDGFHNVVLPRTLSLDQYNYFRFDQFFKANAPRGQKRLLEVGCGASAWLIYFAKEFGYLVGGVDYSELGCELAKENLRLNEVEGNVQCRDLLSIGASEMGSFDIIFSYGVVEHFEQPGEALRVLSALLSPGGWMVVIVPNLGGVYGFLQRWWNEPVYHMHKVLSPTQLAESLVSCGLRTVTAEFYGTFFLSVVNWSLPISAGVLRRMVPRILGRLDRCASRVLRGLAIEVESRLFSPYVIATGTRQATPP